MLFYAFYCYTIIARYMQTWNSPATEIFKVGID